MPIRPLAKQILAGSLGSKQNSLNVWLALASTLVYYWPTMTIGCLTVHQECAADRKGKSCACQDTQYSGKAGIIDIFWKYPAPLGICTAYLSVALLLLYIFFNDSLFNYLHF